MRKNLRISLLASVVFLLSFFFYVSQTSSLIKHNPFTDFNATPKPPTASSLWLNIHTKLDNTDLVNNGNFLLYTGGMISLNGIASTPSVTGDAIPSGIIVADNTVSKPTTSYDMGSNTWTTRVPPGYSSSDIFISGAIITSSTGFSITGSKSSIVTGMFFSNRPSFKQSWFYGIAAYQPPFSYSAIGSPGQVTSVGGGVQAGTPLPEKAFLVAGGSGGGGSNFTGSNSSNDNFMTCQKASCNLSGSIQKTDVTCNGGSNGSATVTLTGGTAPYTYSNSSGVFLQTSNAVSVFNNLPPATYPFTVTDGAGCSVNLSVTISQSSSLSITATVVRGDFENSCDGEATINVTGGTAPFTYVWSDGVTTSSNTRTDLCGPPAGSGVPVQYTVVVTDANGCPGSTSFLIDVTSVAPSSSATSARNGNAAALGAQLGKAGTYAYPNPSNGLVHLQISSTEPANALINVVDISGRIIKSVNINLQSGINYKELQLPNHAGGVYLLQIRTRKDLRTLPIYLY
jgi:hypothetical protein